MPRCRQGARLEDCEGDCIAGAWRTRLQAPKAAVRGYVAYAAAQQSYAV